MFQHCLGLRKATFTKKKKRKKSNIHKEQKRWGDPLRLTILGLSVRTTVAALAIARSVCRLAVATVTLLPVGLTALL